jgi:hypothetical protein
MRTVARGKPCSRVPTGSVTKETSDTGGSRSRPMHSPGAPATFMAICNNVAITTSATPSLLWRQSVCGVGAVLSFAKFCALPNRTVCNFSGGRASANFAAVRAREEEDVRDGGVHPVDRAGAGRTERAMLGPGDQFCHTIKRDGSSTDGIALRGKSGREKVRLLIRATPGSPPGSMGLADNFSGPKKGAPIGGEFCTGNRIAE